MSVLAIRVELWRSLGAILVVFGHKEILHRTTERRCNLTDDIRTRHRSAGLVSSYRIDALFGVDGKPFNTYSGLDSDSLDGVSTEQGHASTS